MSCYHPIAAWRDPSGIGVVFSKELGGDRVDLPCGRCLGCRERRARDWTLRCVHEAQLWDAKCFVTLTYARDCVPAGGSLDHRDFQLFMKRLRKRTGRPVRFFMCGEYGPANMRPHYHAILYNVDFGDRKLAGKSRGGSEYYSSESLEALWTHGRCSVQDVSNRTIGYCTRYIVDKMTGSKEELDEHYTVIDSDGVIVRRKPEYCAVSLKPGIGARWFDKFSSDVLRHDFAVLEGNKYAVPKYYLKLADRVGFDDGPLRLARVVRAKAALSDSTDERLAVREVVHAARMRNLKRDGL